MKLLILGASGDLGRCIASVALQRSELQVTLFVRSVAKLREVLDITQLGVARVGNVLKADICLNPVFVASRTYQVRVRSWHVLDAAWVRDRP